MENTIKIRKGNDNQEPMVVFVSGKSKVLNMWICEKLNTLESVYSNDNDLIDFDYLLYKKLYLEWKIESAKNSVNNWKNELIEFIKNNKNL